ncbi:lysine 2,3-aminomutase [Leptospira ryugenii]|uniref:Lysine 2,3-aminomutase n=2 Tax=Leptospira ryugenii TaxID=1917863 RepID=A0A2P2E531_9LEPT|nr:lysine 2,3-aminomutase [Leptospira ryugenii]
MQNRIQTLDELSSKVTLTESERSAFSEANRVFSFSLSPYYLSLIDPEDPDCPIRKQAIPRPEELLRKPNEVEDPLAEESHMPVKGVTHRYPDRALWYLSHVCAVYCRFCTRKRKVSDSLETPHRSDWELALEYFRTQKEIREVILSGGDPLTLSENQLDWILKELKTIPHINQIRIHTRYPVTLPMRITDELCEVLSTHFPLFVVTHFNHPKEITELAASSIEKLIKKGHVMVLNQSVLLKGINDNSKVLEELNYRLVKVGIKPYYLHQCDEVYGSHGFVVPMERGMQIMTELRGKQSGICQPLYVKDLTGGGGKVPLTPQYYIEEKDGKYKFQNYRGIPFEVSH